jgi:hypothetical protein
MKSFKLIKKIKLLYILIIIETIEKNLTKLKIKEI